MTPITLPAWWPQCPYPVEIFPLPLSRYPAIVPDEAQRTALSGSLGRHFWQIASEEIWRSYLLELQDRKRDGDSAMRDQIEVSEEGSAYVAWHVALPGIVGHGWSPNRAIGSLVGALVQEVTARTEPVKADIQQIKHKAQSIKEATDYLIDNIPDTLYGALGAVNWAGVHCDTVYWQPVSDDYLVEVAKANSPELAAYLQAELSRQGYETEVITEW